MHPLLLLLLLCLGRVTCAVESPPLFTDVELGDSTYRLYLVVYATDVSRADFCMFATSAAARGFRLNVGGLTRGREYQDQWLLDKVWVLRDFVRLVPDAPDVVVMTVDAFDVLLNGGPERVVSELVGSGHSVLFASERGCSGTKWKMKHRDTGCDGLWPVPPVRTTSPFLNSGGLVGFRSEVEELLDVGWAEYQATRRGLLPGEWDPYVLMGDQGLYAQLFSYGRHEEDESEAARGGLRRRLDMSIDYQSRLFLCLYRVDIETELAYAENGTLVMSGHTDCSHLERRMYFEACLGNRPARTQPVVVHFNGPSKAARLAAVARRLAREQWARQIVKVVWRQRLAGAHVWFLEGNTSPLVDICGALLETCRSDATPWGCLAEQM